MDKNDEVVVEEILKEETTEITKKNRKVRVKKDKITNTLVIPPLITPPKNPKRVIKKKEKDADECTIC